MNTILDQFNIIKDLLYDKPIEKFSFSEIADILLKENKTKEDLDVINNLFRFTTILKNIIEDMGTKIIELNVEKIDSKGVDIKKPDELELNIKNMIFLIDTFIDSLIALSRVIEYNENRFNLKKTRFKLLAVRNKLITLTREYSNFMIEDENKLKELKIYANDVIDTFIATAYSLRLKILYEKISKVVNK